MEILTNQRNRLLRGEAAPDIVGWSNRIFTLSTMLFIAAALAFTNCSKQITAYNNQRFLIACDTITLKDSSWYQPVVFNFTSNFIYHTNNSLEECTFRIIEKDEKELFVRSEEDRLYLVTYDPRKDGHITFKRLGRITYFRILNVIDYNGLSLTDSTLVLTSERY